MKLFFTRRFGQEGAEAAIQRYAVRAEGALYTAPSTANGPAVDNQPVWVVIIEELSGPAGQKRSGDKVETVVILDVMTGAEVTGWEQGRRLQVR